MHRIDNDYLETIISVAIKTAPKTVKQGMRSKLPVVRDEAIRRIAKHVADQINNDSVMVVRTELVDKIGSNGRPGVWGVDEVNPTEAI